MPPIMPDSGEGWFKLEFHLASTLALNECAKTVEAPNLIVPKPLHFALIFALGAALAAPGFRVSSAGYAPGARLPASYTCDGAGSSPQLTFHNPPAGTKSFAILGWDDNNPAAAPLSSWEVYDIPAIQTALPEAIPAGKNVMGVKQGLNSFGKLGFSAPCPPKDGKRREYYIDLYALNVSSLGVPAGSNAALVHAAIQRYRLQEAKLLGVYSR